MVGANQVQGELSMIWSTPPANSPQGAYESPREVSVRTSGVNVWHIISDSNFQQPSENSAKRPRKRSYVRSPLNVRKVTSCPHCNVTFPIPGALTYD